MRIRTLIVDDEPLGRERIRALLASDSEVEVIEECADGRRAVAAIERSRPDLVFLDVQMPEMDGFAVLDAIAGDRMPIIIFVTAYDRYAVQAFEVHALDYLLNSFDRDRFQAALERAKEEIRRSKTGALGWWSNREGASSSFALMRSTGSRRPTITSGSMPAANLTCFGKRCKHSKGG